MKKKTLKLASLLLLFYMWGYIVGMLDYRLMIHTALTCWCYVKFAVLMGASTLIIASFASFFIVKRHTNNQTIQSGEISDE